jgi:hypothetical protein
MSVSPQKDRELFDLRFVQIGLHKVRVFPGILKYSDGIQRADLIRHGAYDPVRNGSYIFLLEGTQILLRVLIRYQRP